MIIIHLLASILGGLATVTALWSYGWFIALLCAPLGGSALVLIVASLVAVLPRRPSNGAIRLADSSVQLP
jgi:hypothetical protein